MKLGIDLKQLSTIIGLLLIFIFGIVGGIMVYQGKDATQFLTFSGAFLGIAATAIKQLRDDDPNSGH
jgi:hypothetical protein